jgi:hypothetical protein
LSPIPRFTRVPLRARTPHPPRPALRPALRPAFTRWAALCTIRAGRPSLHGLHRVGLHSIRAHALIRYHCCLTRFPAARPCPMAHLDPRASPTRALPPPGLSTPSPPAPHLPMRVLKPPVHPAAAAPATPPPVTLADPPRRHQSPVTLGMPDELVMRRQMRGAAGSGGSTKRRLAPLASSQTRKGGWCLRRGPVMPGSLSSRVLVCHDYCVWHSKTLGELYGIRLSS